MKIEPCCDSKGNCTRCGECCAAMLPITKQEEKNIRKYINENNIQPEFFCNETDMNLQCCFYDRTNKVCKIYEVRPKICRTFKCNKNIRQILKERDEIQSKSYWNQIKDDEEINVTDMRLLFYDDPRSLLGNVIRAITKGTMKCSKEQFELVKKYLREHGQEELVNCIREEYTNEK